MTQPLANHTVAVLMGGPGSERRISLASGEAVADALKRAGATVVPVDVEGEDFEVPEGVEVAFNVIHGTFGEDGQIQSILEERGIPYTGAGIESSRVAFDKALAKEKFVAAKVPTPGGELIQKGAQPSLSMPLVVKPPCEGSSVGIHIVKEASELGDALVDAGKYGEEILVEEFIEGKELTVGVLGDEVFPIVHIAPQDGWYDINNKYPWLESKGKTEYFCPADLPADVTEAVQAAALGAHRSLGIEVYSRVDVLLHPERGPFVLEVNTLPGMTETSLLPKGAAAMGVDFPSLCARIVEISLATERGNG